MAMPASPISAARPRSACRASCSIISTAAPMPRSPRAATSRTSPTSRCASASSSTSPRSTSRTACSARPGAAVRARPGRPCPACTPAAARRRRRAPRRPKGVPFCLSSVSVCDIERGGGGGREPDLVPALRRSRTAPIWPSCSAWRARRAARRAGLHRRPAGAGRALSRRPSRPVRRRTRAGGGFGQASTHPRWAWDVGVKGKPHSLGNFAPVLGTTSGLDDYVGWIGRNFDAEHRLDATSTGSARTGTGRC